MFTHGEVLARGRKQAGSVFQVQTAATFTQLRNQILQ